MNFYRETIKNAPSVFAIPKGNQKPRCRKNDFALDEITENGEMKSKETQTVIRSVFLKKTAGNLSDFPSVSLATDSSRPRGNRMTASPKYLA